MNRKNFPKANLALTAGIHVCVLLSFFLSPLSAIQVAKFAYKGAPEDLNNKTIRVDGDMVAMAENVFVKTISVRSDTASDTPSIFFVIDNSGSMSGVGDNNPTDRNGYRFAVTSALLDTLQNHYPNVEVGLAVFGTTLWFDQTDQPFFVPCPNQQGSYVPLLQLGKTYPAYGGLSGYAILKSILRTTNLGRLAYSPSNSQLSQTSTNITAGFDAAINAYASPTAINFSRKNKQFIIFFSDGAANTPSNDRNEMLRFQQGVNTPTTFTVFFNNNNPPQVPQTIDSMTKSIQNNGYSANNPKSAYWGYRNTTQDSLMSFLMVNVMTVITSTSNGTPKSVTVGNTALGAATAANWSSATGQFTFSRLFPLLGNVTTFNYAVVYSLSKNSIYLKDTTHLVNNLNIQIDPARTLPTDSFEVKHWDRSLIFRFSGAPITVATELMDSVELYFPWSPGDANYSYTNVQIELTSGVPPVDREMVTLTKGPTFFSGKFKRATSNTRTVGNRVLEHASGATDIITAVFRNKENPLLPLDTLRVALALNITPLCIADSAVTRDVNGNGYIDHIDLYVDKNITLTNGVAKNFTIRYGNTFFPVTDIAQDNGNSRLYHLTVTEQTQTGFQTSWLPTMQAALIPGMEPINLICKDGCAPVITRIVKYVTSEKRETDTVKVSFSEKIFGADGGFFSIANQPAQAFLAWWSQNGSTFTGDADTLLAGIPNFVSVVNDSVLVFTMANRRDLTKDNWLNIRAARMLIRDKAGNFPQDVNRKVQVEIVVVQLPVKALITPPFGPTTRHVQTGPLVLENEFLGPTGFDPSTSKFVQWVTKEQAGVAISISSLSIPPKNPATGLREKVPATIKVYDIAGNCVNWSKFDDIFVNISGPFAREIDFYWNGFNYDGMKAAPGVYRATIYIAYPKSSKLGSIKLNKKVGLRY